MPQTAPHACPNCGGDPHAPAVRAVGDLLVCFRCSAFLRCSSDFGFQLLTHLEWNELSAEDQRAMRQAKKANDEARMLRTGEARTVRPRFGHDDTFNRYAVGVRGDRLVSLVLCAEFDRAEALNLAAYLLVLCEIALSDGAENDRTDAEFRDLVQKIRAT